MKIFPTTVQRESAFTMVEVALSIAIVAFAMVAIIGILPTGFEAQRLNREETVINQDGTYFLEAIRSGSVGLSELTNFVDSIVISNHLGNVRSFGMKASEVRNFSSAVPLTNAHFILGMMSTPQLEIIDVDRNGNPIYSTNEVAALVRSISGTASQRFRNEDFKENAFSYLMSSKIVPYLPTPTNFQAQGSVLITTNRYLLSANIANNLYELQLKFRWPVTKIQNQGNGGNPNIEYRVGKNEKTFRALVSGTLLRTNGFPYLNRSDNRNDVSLYLFKPQDYTPPAL